MADELKDQRVVTMMSPTELKAIDDWMFSSRIRSRGEAIRRLCQIGLASQESVEMLKLTFQQLQRLLISMRQGSQTDPAFTRVRADVADASILLLNQAITSAIPALTMVGDGDLAFRMDARDKLLARLKALDINTDEGVEEAFGMATWFLREIGALEEMPEAAK